ncbi:MAG: TolC family outer membrane protein [Burkholderiales bacterium]|nr:TolC family outer membrane protein [Burkholderiales bacterium]
MRANALPSRRRPRGLLRQLGAGLALGAAMAVPSWGMSFKEAFDAARQYDAQYRGAGYERESARQGVPLARSSLLPSVAFSASTSDITGTRTFPNSLNQEFKTALDYSSSQTSLQLRVPIFNYEAIARWRVAEAQSDGAEAVYIARGLELVDRLGTAYLQVLLALDSLKLAQAQVVTLKAQLERAQQRFTRGEGTRTEVAQAQGGLSVGEIRVTEAEAQIKFSKRDLQRQIGLDVPPLQELPADFSPGAEVSERLEDWLARAYSQSPTLRAKEQAVTAARMNVHRNAAGHLPRLDLVASAGRSQSDSLSTINQTAVQKTIGVQLSVPIYSGGGVDASVKQAVADRSRAEEDVRAQREAIAIEIQRNYQVMMTGEAKIKAYRVAVDAGEVTLTGVSRALDAGLATTADVVDAQSRLYSAKRDLLQVRYEYLLSRLRLNAQAGTAMTDIVADINSVLSAPPNPTQGAVK